MAITYECRKTMMAQQKREMVTFDLPDYKRETHDNIEGCTVTVEYDSSFGGTQTIEGTAEIVREWENGRRRRYMVVGDRKISSGYVFSAADGRQVGRVNSITATMEAETAIEWVAKDWNGHDVDRHDNEIYVQFWSGELNSEMTEEEWFNHSDSIRFTNE